MKGVVFHGVGDIRLDDGPDPGLCGPNDAIVGITARTIGAAASHRCSSVRAAPRPAAVS